MRPRYISSRATRPAPSHSLVKESTRNEHGELEVVDDVDFVDEATGDETGYDIGIGDDLFMVGRQIGREGMVGNTPVVRFGCISQMPGDPIVFLGSYLGPQTAYLAEMRSRN